MQKRMLFFVAVIFAVYETRLTIFNNMSFGKTIETTFVFFYKLSSFRDTSILKTGTVHQKSLRMLCGRQINALVIFSLEIKGAS